MIAWAQMGDANASIPTPQPVLPRPMFGAYGAVPAHDLACTSSRRRRSRPGWPTGWPSTGGWCRSPTSARLTKADMPENDALPDIEVDPDTFTVRIDGEVVEPEPVARAADGPALLPLLMPR